MKAEQKWLNNPEVFRVNVLPAHSDHITYANEDEAESGITSLRQTLDGQWDFKWSNNPDNRPKDFWREDFDSSDFDAIAVPAHIELQGYGQIQYISALYPWDGHAELRPPQTDPNYNPVGSYIRRFDLDESLKGKRVCISFQGVEEAFYLWLNGTFIGYAEDSFTPSDFDLTPYIRDKGNRLCVEVYKRSSAAWIEDQDFFHFSGIFRSVFLYAKPEVNIDDLWIEPVLNDDNVSGKLSVRLLLSGKTDCAKLLCRIFAPNGEKIFDDALTLHKEGEYLRSQTLNFNQIKCWSHENPALYRIVLTVCFNDNIVGIVPYEIGFRRFELKNGIMLLNGKRVMFNGVNRHEWNPEKGRAINDEDMYMAMQTFIKNNINAVRTSHYPNQSKWYELCDKNGIYMIDEANLESHGSWQKLGVIDPSWNVPGNLPEWRECAVDRARSMFERDKNHVSILLWSCGNEAYAGEDILAMADFFRSHDASRLVHYEGVINNREFDRISDIESRMYAPPKDIRAYLESNPEKPFVLCEYMHDLGNSIGGMESYIRLGEEFEQYQGGFIWDYMDQALWRTDTNGRRVLGYGGDFNDRQTDYACSANGIVFADGTEKPAMQEVRYWYSSAEERKKFDKMNEISRSCISADLKKKTPQALTIVHGDAAIGIRGRNFEILFSYPEGGPCSIVSDNKEWLWRAPRPAYWRAPIENDFGNRFVMKSSIWSAADAYQKCIKTEILKESADEFSMKFTYGAAVMPDLKTDVTYTVRSDSTMSIDIYYHGQKGQPELALMGLRFSTPAPVETVEWLGLSGETYPDRKRGGSFGWHTENPGISEYLVPQECGNHEDTRAIKLKTADNKSLNIFAHDKPFSFSAIPYTPQQLEQAAHKEELPKPVRTVITVCGKMRGVGGIDSWGSDVEEPYRISAENDVKFSVKLEL